LQIYLFNKQKVLKLGNLDSKRDWGFAGDYVKAMKLMIENDNPEDYVIATGQTYSIKEFCKLAFEVVGIENWEEYVQIDSDLLRPAEVDLLIGDSTKAKRNLGWKPETNFYQLVKLMVESDIELVKNSL